MVRIVIADDHPIVREGLKRILSQVPEFSVIAEAGNGNETLNIVLNNSCDLLMLDLSLPSPDGLDVLKTIRKQSSTQLPVLIVSFRAEDEYAFRALQAGASGYITKDSTPDTLIPAIHKVLRGGRYVSPALAEKLAVGLIDDPDLAPHKILSDREFQTLCMLASGKRVGEMAAELNLSVKTISTYRTRLIEKLNLRNNAELTRYAIQRNLIE